MPGLRQRLHWPLICACLLILPPLPCQADTEPHNAREFCDLSAFQDYQVKGRMKVADETGAAVTLTPVIATALEDAISPEIDRILGFTPTCPIINVVEARRLLLFTQNTLSGTICMVELPSSQPSSEQNALSLQNLRSDHSGTVIVDLRNEASRTVIKANEVLQQEYTQDTLQVVGQVYSIDFEWSTEAKDEDHADTLGPAIAIPVFFVIILPCFIGICICLRMNCFRRRAREMGMGPTLVGSPGDTWAAGDPFRQAKGGVDPDDGAAWKAVEMGKPGPEASPPYPPAYPPPPGYPHIAIAAQAPSASPAPYPTHGPTYPAPYPAPSPAYPPPYSATTPSAYPAASAYPTPTPSAYPSASPYPTPAPQAYSASPQVPPAAQQPAPYPSAHPPPPPASQYPSV